MRVMTLFCLAVATPVSAFHLSDPKGAAVDVIVALQNCGPPEIFQFFSPDLYSAVESQTGGNFCYSQLQQAGQIRSIVLTNSVESQFGPYHTLRAEHDNATVDYWIGLHNAAELVNSFYFRVAAVKAPPAPQADPNTVPNQNPNPNPADTSDLEVGKVEGNGNRNSCTQFPILCQ